MTGNKITRQLKEYFKKRDDILMVFIFGSYVKNQQTTESDFDIAVYFKPKTKILGLEWESENYYQDEDKIWGDVEKIAGRRTDFVVLNRAPATLVYSILQEGIPLNIKDRSFYLRFFLMISSAAEYFREFTKNFWEIKQRSLSLTEIDKNRLINILDFFKSELKDYPKFADLEQSNYQSDNVLKRNVERWVENIINSSIDIAKILLASEKKKIPQTYREIMRELSLIKNFESETAENLAIFAKLRNILAHEYLDIRFTQIKKFIQESEPAYQSLSKFTEDFIANK
jgi:uncharacterized protein YutE (UPF0331/DUF86 family)/predicted nucleotidyltransferase